MSDGLLMMKEYPIWSPLEVFSSSLLLLELCANIQWTGKNWIVILHGPELLYELVMSFYQNVVH